MSTRPRKAIEADEASNGAVPQGRRLNDYRPITMASAYLNDRGYLTGQRPDQLLLRHWREDFYAFEHCAYRKLIDEVLESDVTRYLNSLAGRGGSPLSVKRRMVAEVRHQLKALCQVQAEAMPGWLDAGVTPPLFLNGISGLGAPFWVPDLRSRFVGAGSAEAKLVAVVESIAFLAQANLDAMGRRLPPPGTR